MHVASDKQSPIPNIVLYDFQPTRSAQCALDFLRGFDGYLNVDSCPDYESTKATLAGCWTHARRKFIEAEKGMSKGKSVKATVAINHIKNCMPSKLPHCKSVFYRVVSRRIASYI